MDLPQKFVRLKVIVMGCVHNRGFVERSPLPVIELHPLHDGFQALRILCGKVTKQSSSNDFTRLVFDEIIRVPVSALTKLLKENVEIPLGQPVDIIFKLSKFALGNQVAANNL